MSRKRKDDRFFDDPNKRRVAVGGGGLRISVQNREYNEPVYSNVRNFREQSPPRNVSYDRRHERGNYYPDNRNNYNNNNFNNHNNHNNYNNNNNNWIRRDHIEPRRRDDRPNGRIEDARHFLNQHRDNRRDYRDDRHHSVGGYHDNRRDDWRDNRRDDRHEVGGRHNDRNDMHVPHRQEDNYHGNKGRGTWGGHQQGRGRQEPQQQYRQKVSKNNGNMNQNTNAQPRPRSINVNITKMDFGTLTVGSVSEPLEVSVINNAAEPCRFYGVEFIREEHNITMRDQKKLCNVGTKVVIGPNCPHRVIPPTSFYSIHMTYRATEIGNIENKLIFYFEGRKITRSYTAKVVVDQADQALLAPSKPYKPFTVRNRTLPSIREKPQLDTNNNNSFSEIGEPLGSTANRQRTPTKSKSSNNNNNNNNNNAARHHQHPPPPGEDFLAIFDLPFEELLRNAEQPLTFETHSKKFQSLLVIEDQQMEVDIRLYDIQGATLKTIPAAFDAYSLNVPGIAENRPSVMLKDKVYFRKSGDENGKEYEGEVLAVFREDVDINFEKDPIPYSPGAKFDVRFTFTKLFAQRMIRSLNSPATLPASFLFPTPELHNVPLPKKPPTLKLYNTNLNDQQQLAVSRIVHTPYTGAPFLIFGPPGTGKTLTLVEAIAQLLQDKKNTILVCAPSNQACDVIIERIANYQSLADMHIIRLNAIQRSVEEVSDVVKRYCVINGGQFTKATKLERYSLIVCTCILAGALVDARLNKEYQKQFSHIFIDEAGHGLEPEILVPLSLKSPRTQVTIAGDPYQLGPTVRSNLTRTHGLEKSFLERLCELPLYSRYPDEDNVPPEVRDNNFHNPLFVTKLIRNYRSHPAILYLPNELFYHGDLVEAADPEMTHSLLTCKHLPSNMNKHAPFPIVFHGLQGEDVREGNSPSFFNTYEIMAISTWIDNLVNDTSIKPRVRVSDIGIITPFRKQVQKIRIYLSAKGREGAKVGSVEDFQGQERRIIIISGVRSNKAFVEFDQKHKLGLLSNSKRFNVAVTRAKALLIVIANPDILALDKDWSDLIRYCIDNKSYHGQAPIPDSILNNYNDKSDSDNESARNHNENNNNNNNTSTTTTTTTTTPTGEQHDENQEPTKIKKESDGETHQHKSRENGDEDGQGGEEDVKEELIEEDGDEEKQEDVDDRDSDQEFESVSMITGQEGPEWRGSF